MKVPAKQEIMHKGTLYRAGDELPADYKEKTYGAPVEEKVPETKPKKKNKKSTKLKEDEDG